MALPRAALVIGPALLALALAALGLLATSNAAALTRTTALVSKPTGVADPNSGDAEVRRVSLDGRRVIFETTQKLTPDDNDGGYLDTYERSGGTTKLISKPTGVPDPGTDESNLVAASVDCSRVFFVTTQKMTSDDNDTSRLDLYERSGGATKLVSKPTNVVDPDTANAFSVGVSDDGRRAFFETTEKLAPDDTDAGLTDVYERSGGTTKVVTKPTGVANPNVDAGFMAGFSNDGRRVFFIT